MRKPSTSGKQEKPAVAPHREDVRNIPVHRIRDEENPPAHRIDPNAADVVQGEVVVTGYAWGGKEVPADDPMALAKKSFDPATKITRYWLKRATAGADRGYLFNPQSPAFTAGAERRVHNNTGRNQYEFKPSNKAAFELYLKFMTPPHNPLNLRGAERLS